MGANLKEVRERIKSVISTQQITKAMKLVSASKLRRAQDAITKIRPYSNRLNDMLNNIVSNSGDESFNAYAGTGDKTNILIILVTSNRGLCGAFNTNVIKKAVDLVENKYADQRLVGNVTMMFIGKKGYDFFRKRYTDIKFNTEYLNLFADLSFNNVSNVSKLIVDDFTGGRLNEVVVVYGKFRNAAVQEPHAEVFLPVEGIRADEILGSPANYIFEPNKNKLLEELVPTILQVQFQRYLLDTHASEHGARMTAMDKATENAGEMLKELKINYNKARQEAITNELSEIVGGAAALGS